jgi:4-amino-4-deoxy-L-arabinose transferase-like glycosyltransferase
MTSKMNKEVIYKQIAILLVCIAAAMLSFFIVGNHPRTTDDASGYIALGTNIVEHGTYSMNGKDFSLAREPGYPLFLSLVFRVFGNGNLLAVSFVQCALLGIIGYVIYRLFRMFDESVAILAGAGVAGFPSYGYYMREIMTEAIFAVLLAFIFYLVIKLVRLRGVAPWYWHALLGFLCGYEALIRTQFLFFLPFGLVLFGLYLRRDFFRIWPKVGIAVLAFMLVVSSWIAYVHTNTGKFSMTEGRQGWALFIRADRASLSYSEINRYAFEWIRRSISGGRSSDFLEKHEYHYLQALHDAQATTPQAYAQIYRQSIATIINNPGHYLYGNIIEMMKLGYIEHDYTDSQHRLFRPIMYTATYVFCLFGLYQLFRSRNNGAIKTIAGVAIAFLVYNYLVLSAFDTIPRYNTPYLMFYLIIGFVGVVLLRARKKEAK